MKRMTLAGMYFLSWGLILALCGHAFGAPVSMDVPVDKAGLRKILSDLEIKMKKIESMQTKFSQTKQLRLFQHEVQLQGTLSMEKPERFKWHTESPIRYSIIFEKDKVYQWDEDTDRVQSLSLAGTPVLKMIIDQMQTWFYGSYVALLDQYDIHVLSKEPLSLEFLPHKDVLTAAVIKAITIRFRQDESYIESIRIEEKNGDQSLLSFTDTVLNAKIDPGVWKANNRVS